MFFAGSILYYCVVGCGCRTQTNQLIVEIAILVHHESEIPARICSTQLKESCEKEAAAARNLSVKFPYGYVKYNKFKIILEHDYSHSPS